MADYSNLSILIVDPNQGMRAGLHNMLTQLAVTKIDHAVNSGTAIRALDKKSYDLILCEYDLSGGEGGQDGQQLLEDLRHHKLIAQWTIFIMITSEGIYSKVMGAAELTPTDYILKPFTVDVLSQRIARAVDRRSALLPIYQLIGQGRPRDAIKACVDAQTAQPRYAIDYARLRAELLMSVNDLPEAEKVYRAILENRQVGWVQFGVAKCLALQKRQEETLQALEELIAANPKFMAAYDLLAQTHQALGHPEEAKQVLERAVAISPHMVHRLRQLGQVAYETGDVLGAEKAFKQVVAKAKYSEFRDPEDHLNLVKALVTKGDAPSAANVIRDMERSLRAGANTDVCRALAASMLQGLNGNEEAAASELLTAFNALGDAKGMSRDLKLSLVHNCLKNKMDQQATALLTNLTGDPTSGIKMEDTLQIYQKAGRDDLVQTIDARIDRLVDELVKQAAVKSRQGDLGGAVLVLTQALRKRPDNPGLMSATVTAMLRQLNDIGMESSLMDQCSHLLERMRALEGGHPLLATLSAQFASTREKYHAPTGAT